MDEQIREGVGPAERIAAPRAEESTPVAAGDLARRTRGAGGAGEWFHPLVELTKNRVREFLREPEAVFWVFIFPVLLACALGIAFRNTEPEKIRIGVEIANAASADALVRAFANSPDVEAVALSPEDAAQGLRGGRLALVVKSAAGGAAAGPSAYTYRYDPTRPESRAARLAVDDALQRSLGRQDVTAARDEKVSEPGARYIDFLIPGLIGLNLMGTGMWGLGFAVVQARSRKLLKRFAATPMRRSHYLLSFMLSRLVFLAMEVGAILGFAWLVFGVGVRGSLLGVALITLLGSLAFAGIGLLVAARPRTIEGVSGLMNFVMLPMWLLSGTFFSSDRFPEMIQPFIKALPLTALNEAMRAVMNDGASLAATWAQLAILVAWAAVSFVLALRLFRWQ